MCFERIVDTEKYEPEILRFVFEIYRSTGGSYPRMEWLAQKPALDDYEGFARAYGEFLHFRVTEELDEIYIMRRDRLIATFALVYKFEGKDIPWIPESLKNCMYLEFFMVHPEFRGRGIGRNILNFAITRSEEMQKNLCVVTFRDLDAYEYYLHSNFKEIAQHRNFAILQYMPKI